MDTLVSVKNVTKTFPVGKTLLGKPDKFVHAVNNVSFDIYKGAGSHSLRGRPRTHSSRRPDAGASAPGGLPFQPSHGCPDHR